MNDGDLSMRSILEKGLCTLREILRSLIIGPIVRLPPQNASQVIVLGAANTEVFWRFALEPGELFYVDAALVATIRLWGTTKSASGALSLAEVSDQIVEFHKSSVPGTTAYAAPQKVVAISIASGTANGRLTLWREADLLPWCDSAGAM